MLLKHYQVLKEATKLDIFDLAFEFSSESLNLLSLEPTNLPRKGVIKRIAIFFWHLFQSATEFRRRKGARIPTDSFVFFAMNKNEKNSLSSVFAKVPEAYWIGYGDNAANGLSFFWAHVLACLYSPLVLASFLKAKGYKRKSFSYIFDNYLIVYGLYVVTRLWLMRIKPKAVILANDVNTYTRVAVKAARDEGISTFYVQHASVPENFPPLAFDYALLEGYDALRTHAQLGETQTQVFLVGMPRHDPYFQHINKKAGITSIGICTNGLDPMHRADDLCSSIRREFPNLSLILRPHDADLRQKEWKELSKRYDMDFSDSTGDTSFEFLRKVDAIIAGESNILLEAAIMGVVPLYYDFGQAHLDWYRFERNGLVEYTSDPAVLCRILNEILRNRPYVRPKAKPYCATIGTSYDGRSSDVASELIRVCALADKANFEGWKRIPNMNMEAYELSCDQDSA